MTIVCEAAFKFKAYTFLFRSIVLTLYLLLNFVVYLTVLILIWVAHRLIVMFCCTGEL
jgi:hypothetical protein